MKNQAQLFLQVMVFLVILPCIDGRAHDVITTRITFHREIIRIFQARCVSCHQQGGDAFPLTSYQEARPWAKAIQEEVLLRRMPPWGAVKGFGKFHDEQALTLAQIDLIVDWVEGGAPEGEQENLPPLAKPSDTSTTAQDMNEMPVRGDTELPMPIDLVGLLLRQVPDGLEMQVVAELPHGRVIPLLWLHDFRERFNHPFLLKTPLALPAGTTIRGVPQGATIVLLYSAEAGVEGR
jgi:hypothetical protein